MKKLLAAAAAASLLLLSSACGGGAKVPPTIVTFTFDDGWADQKPALDALLAREMPATLYVNSARINQTNYMTRGQLAAYASHRMEIAGHTLTHADLTKLSPKMARHEICDDRAVLANWGFRPTSFAYPFGSLSPEVKQIVKSCGYNSARTLPGLRSPGYGCIDDCPPAESIPPADPWAIRTPTTIRNNTTLEILKQDVTQAEKGGGWVPLVFHHICEGCADNSMDLKTFQAFIKWLDKRPSSTEVRTVDQVIGGDFKGPQGLSPLMPKLPPPSAPPQIVDQPFIKRSTHETSVAFTVFGVDINQSMLIFTGSIIALSCIITYRIATKGNRHSVSSASQGAQAH